MIAPLGSTSDTPDCVPSRKKLMEKINEIVGVLNENSQLPKTSEPVLSVSEPITKPEETESLSFEGYSPVGGNPEAIYFMPPPGVGHVESDGTVIQGMIARNRLPSNVLQHFNQRVSHA